MKPVSRTIVIIAAAMVGVGFLLAFLGFAIGGFDIRNVGSNSSYDHNSYTIDPSEVTAVNISEIDCAVTLSPSNSDEITVDCYENNTYRYQIELSPSGTLTIQKITEKTWFFQNWFSADFTDKPLTVTIPSDLIASVSIGNVSGSITVENLSTLSLTASDTSGNILLQNVSAADLVSLTNVSGDITTSDCACSGGLHATATSGKIQLQATEVNNDVSVSSVSGDLRMVNLQCGGDVDADSTSGSIVLESLIADNMHFKTVSGSITGTLHVNSGDYSIDSDSVSGKVSIMGGSVNGTKQLEAYSTSGDINLVFE